MNEDQARAAFLAVLTIGTAAILLIEWKKQKALQDAGAHVCGAIDDAREEMSFFLNDIPQLINRQPLGTRMKLAGAVMAGKVPAFSEVVR
ncbi:MAG TPA: hypothetical protein VKA67_02250 [Verrucomicrobiae bacterium]|nr:hypothetical protein [Verrucomicrobiae bacterium]